MLKADGVITSIYLDGYNSIKFKYVPRNFILGIWITIITVIILLIYFAMRTIKYKRNSNTRTETTSETETKIE